PWSHPPRPPRALRRQKNRFVDLGGLSATGAAAVRKGRTTEPQTPGPASSFSPAEAQELPTLNRSEPHPARASGSRRLTASILRNPPLVPTEPPAFPSSPSAATAARRRR